MIFKECYTDYDGKALVHVVLQLFIKKNNVAHLTLIALIYFLLES